MDTSITNAESVNNVGSGRGWGGWGFGGGHDSGNAHLRELILTQTLHLQNRFADTDKEILKGAFENRLLVKDAVEKIEGKVSDFRNDVAEKFCEVKNKLEDRFRELRERELEDKIERLRDRLEREEKTNQTAEIIKAFCTPCPSTNCASSTTK